MTTSVAGWGSMAVCLLLTVVCRAAAPVHTGSQATYVHRIQLFDEKGQLINTKSKAPYSTKKTCGKCHDYEKISTGWHFQAGLHEAASPNDASAEWLARLGEPFFRTHPATGTQIPMSFRDWAKASGQTPTDLGMNQFEFALKFGPHIPGGGMLENTRDKTGKIAHLSGEPWDKTGVLEVDCLMCHLRQGYNPEMRAAQIGYHNFKWAGTAAAGFGLIRGEASKAGEGGGGGDATDPFEAEKEQAQGGGVSVDVDYTPGIFDKGDFVTLGITRHVPNTNCLFCHYTRSKPVKGGVDPDRVSDIHFEAGFKCTDCHKNDLDHKISRGDGSPADLAANADNARLSCHGCHDVGRAAAPKDDHPGLPAFHLKTISCTACHSGPKPGPETVMEQTSIAHGLGLSTEEDLSKHTTPAIYAGAPYRTANDKIGQYRYAYPRWWGKKIDQKIVPLSVAMVEGALKQVATAIKDDDKDGAPEVNTDAEIAAVLGALAKPIADKEKNAKPVLVARGKVYEATGTGVTATTAAVAKPYRWALAHPVRPAREALGAGGCTDCHSSQSPFYFARIKADGSVEGATVAQSHEWIGAKVCLAKVGGVRESFVKKCLLWILPITLLLCLFHYVTFGPKRILHDGPDELIERFTVIERWMHATLLVTCVALMITGLGFLLAKLPNASKGFWTGENAAELHEVCGFIFAGAAVLAFVRWFATAIPVGYDIEWIKVFGGYLWIKAHPAAGKFNFGQKMLFWGAMALAIILGITGIMMAAKPGGDGGMVTIAYTVHDVAAVLMIAMMIAHIYLATIANPGTLISIFAGRVLRSWASFHHPNWVQEQSGKLGGKPSSNH